MGPARGIPDGNKDKGTDEDEEGAKDKDTDEEEGGMISLGRAGFTTSGVREDEAGMTMEEEERPTRG